MIYNRGYTVFSTRYRTLRIKNFHDNNVRIPQFAAKLYYVFYYWSAFIIYHDKIELHYETEFARED